jgi:predicted DNA-binding transcriptional regulator AlpA
MIGTARMIISEFLLTSEVEKITRLRDPTRRRMENRGTFPRRIHIAPRRVAWRTADINVWVADPEGWAARRSRGDSGPCRDDLAEDL